MSILKKLSSKRFYYFATYEGFPYEQNGKVLYFDSYRKAEHFYLSNISRIADLCFFNYVRSSYTMDI